MLSMNGTTGNSYGATVMDLENDVRDEMATKCGERVREKKSVLGMVLALTIVAVVSVGSWRKMTSFSGNDEAELAMLLDTTIPVQSSLDRAYNIFRGNWVDIHFSQKIGSFSQSGSTVPIEGTNYYMLDGVEVLTSGVKTCKELGSATSSEKTATTLDMRQEGDSQMNGYDQTTTVSASVPAGGAEVGASRDLRLALMFGSSSSMTTSHEKSTRDYSYHLQAKTEADSFKTITNWLTMNTFSYDSNFVAAMNDVANSASGTAQSRRSTVFKFFKNWGSHVISESVWGMECTKNFYFKAGYRSASSSLVETTVRSRELEIFGIQLGSSSSTTTQSYTDSSTGVTYEETGLQCQGELPSACNGAFTGSMMPMPMKSSVLGVWNLTVPGVTNGALARKAFVDSVDDLVIAAQNCNQTKCNGRGVCTLSASFWDNINTWSGSFDVNRDFANECVCETGVGPNCADLVKCLPPLPWYYMLGGTIDGAHENVVSAPECESKCAQNSACYFYVHESQQRICLEYQNPAVTMYMGPIYQITSARCRGDDGAMCTRHVGFDMPGNDFYSGIDVQNLDECENLCISDHICKGYTFQESTNKCWLKIAQSSLKVYSGLVSGSCRT